MPLVEFPAVKLIDVAVKVEDAKVLFRAQLAVEGILEQCLIARIHISVSIAVSD